MSLKILDLGRRPYPEVWMIQKRLASERSAGKRTDTLILTEHEPVYTRGTSSRSTPHPSLPHPMYDIERGGDITYHGPGQLTGYPIIHLKEAGLLVGTYLRRLETVLIDTLVGFDIPAQRIPGRTGVWTQDRKIASIGVAVRGWVTYHGFSLNVAGDLTPFNAVRPCGLDPIVMTSIAKELGRAVAFDEVKSKLLKVFRRGFAAAEALCIL